MIPKTGDAEADFERFARSWLKRISAGQWEAAFAELDLPPAAGEPYTSERFRREVEQDHFRPGTRFAKAHPEGIVYSDPDEVPLEVSVYRRRPGVCECEVELPLNGERSDLTAGFELVEDGDRYLVRLDWLHVL